MERLTKKLSDGTYALIEGHDVNEVIVRLAKYEDMYEALCFEFSKITADMEKMRAADKSKTVTYKQLIANKMMNQNLIGRFEIYGL